MLHDYDDTHACYDERHQYLNPELSTGTYTRACKSSLLEPHDDSLSHPFLSVTPTDYIYSTSATNNIELCAPWTGRILTLALMLDPRATDRIRRATALPVYLHACGFGSALYHLLLYGLYVENQVRPATIVVDHGQHHIKPRAQGRHRDIVITTLYRYRKAHQPLEARKTHTITSEDSK